MTSLFSQGAVARHRPRSLAGCLSAVGAAVGVLLAVPAGAQPVPDAGQTLRELQRPPAPPQGRAAPQIVVPEDERADADAGVRIQVQRIRIEGAEHLPEAELLALVADLPGKELSLGELRNAARRITAYYRQKGYLVARAYLPQQEIRDGVLTIAVLEGRLNRYTIDNRSLVRGDRIDSVVAAQKLPGQVIHTARTDRTMLLLSDLPGVGRVSGNLQPGDQVGTSDLLIDVPAGKRVEGEISADNYGNRYTGRNRVNGHVDINSPTGIGDRVSLSTTVTEEDLLYGRAAYDAPVGSQGLRLGAALTRSRYELGKEFDSLDAKGTASTLSAQASYPVLRELDRNVWVSFNLERRRLRDDIESTDSRTRRGARVATLDVYGDLTDGLASLQGYSTWRVSVLAGDVSIDSAAAKAADAAGPKTEGSYRKLSASVSRLQSLGASTNAFVALSGQLADKNLDSSEKFVLGGRYGIRAYPQGEGAGDEGWLATLELRQRLAPWMQGSVFYDVGQVRFNKDAYVAGSNHRTLRGYGLGLGFDRGDFSLNLYAAWRGKDAAVTAPDSHSRIGAMGSWRF